MADPAEQAVLALLRDSLGVELSRDSLSHPDGWTPFQSHAQVYSREEIDALLRTAGTRLCPLEGHAALRKLVFEREGGRCVMCFRRIALSTAHITPHEKMYSLVSPMHLSHCVPVQDKQLGVTCEFAVAACCGSCNELTSTDYMFATPCRAATRGCQHWAGLKLANSELVCALNQRIAARTFEAHTAAARRSSRSSAAGSRRVDASTPLVCLLGQRVSKGKAGEGITAKNTYYMYLDTQRDAIGVRFDDEADWVQVPVSQLTVIVSRGPAADLMMPDAPEYRIGQIVAYERTADPDCGIAAGLIRGTVLAIRRQAYWICPLPEFCPQEHVASECSSEGQQGVWNEAIAFGSDRLSESSEE